MATEITSKEELASLTAKLDGKSLDVTEVISDLKSSLSGISNYDGIDVSGAASTLSSNLSNISKDLENVVTNIKNYVSQVTGFDIDDFNASSESSSSSVSYEDIFQTDGSKEQNARVIWNYLKYKGLSDAAAAGVLGNIQAESGFNPGIEEIANGIGYGLIQWSFGRRTALENAAKAAGVDPSNLQFQLEYLWDESLDPNTSYGKKLAAAGFYTTSDPGDAAYYFHKYVEISADSKSAIQNNRCAPAESWYEKFKGTDAGDVEGKESVSWDEVTTTTAATVIAGTKVNSNYSSSYSSYSSSSGNYSSGSYSGGSYSGGSSSGSTGSSHVQRGAITKVTISSGDPNIDVSKYHNNLELGFEVTVGNLAYKLDEKDIELLCAIVAAESDKSYDDALAVISTILNRCESPNWINSHGTDPIAQATAPNQFVVYQHGSYMSYMDGKAPEEVVAAVKDALAGVRNHEYLSFRSNGTTSYSDNMITVTGNRYK